MKSSSFKLKKIDPTAMYKPANYDTADISGNGLAEENSESDTQHGNQDFPHLFSFMKTPSPVHIRDSGTPELVPFRMSMNPEPTWLDQPEWDLLDGTDEAKNGFFLSSPHELYVPFPSYVLYETHHLTLF